MCLCCSHLVSDPEPPIPRSILAKWLIVGAVQQARLILADSTLVSDILWSTQQHKS